MLPKQKLTIERARQIMGKDAEKLTDEQIADRILQLKQLAKFCLDTYEKETFGKTIAEMDS